MLPPMPGPPGLRRMQTEQAIRLDILVEGLNSRLAAFCLLMVGLLPLGAVAQITESLLPYPVPPRAPQERPSAFAPIGLRLGDFFWFPRAELAHTAHQLGQCALAAEMCDAPLLHGRLVVGAAELADGVRTQGIQPVPQLGGYVGVSHGIF